MSGGVAADDWVHGIGAMSVRQPAHVCSRWTRSRRLWPRGATPRADVARHGPDSAGSPAERVSGRRGHHHQSRLSPWMINPVAPPLLRSRIKRRAGDLVKYQFSGFMRSNALALAVHTCTGSRFTPCGLSRLLRCCPEREHALTSSRASSAKAGSRGSRVDLPRSEVCNRQSTAAVTRADRRGGSNR